MIRELFQKGWTKTAIAEATGFDRKTISKYLKSNQLPERKASEQQKESKLEPYKSYILQRVKEGTTNCVVLLEEIQTMGYEGKMTILRDFVRPLRQQPKKQATLRFETPPGKQAQNGLGVRGKILSEWQSARHLCICDDIRLFPNEVRRVYNQHESRNPHEVSYECFFLL